MRIESDVKLDFSDVLIKPKRSTLNSRMEVNLKRSFRFRHSPFEWTGIPIISSNMTSVTTLKVASIMAEHDMLACMPKNMYTAVVQDNYIPSIGMSTAGTSLYPFLCLDVANGYLERVIERVGEIRKINPEVILIVGNVVTAEQTEALILAGADIVKVGIGSGAACSTRIKTGIGMPQLSAVIECADAAHGLGGHIISDGGCVVPGDCVKAFAAGSDFVMLGGMLAGHDENSEECERCNGTGRWCSEELLPGDLKDRYDCRNCNGSGKIGAFYGMSSERGATEIAGGLKDYRASEGWELRLEPRGPIKNTLQDITGGLRSACSYVGAKRIKDLPKCTTFVQVNRQANTSLWENRI